MPAVGLSGRRQFADIFSGFRISQAWFSEAREIRLETGMPAESRGRALWAQPGLAAPRKAKAEMLLPALSRHKIKRRREQSPAAAHIAFARSLLDCHGHRRSRGGPDGEGHRYVISSRRASRNRHVDLVKTGNRSSREPSPQDPAVRRGSGGSGSSRPEGHGNGVGHAWRQKPPP